jgi:hypothetical protein
VGEDDIRRTMSDAPDAQAAADQLVDLANRAGGLDNITVVVLEFGPGDGVELAERATRDSVRSEDAGGADGTPATAESADVSSGDEEPAPASAAPAGTDVTQIGATAVPPQAAGTPAAGSTAAGSPATRGGDTLVGRAPDRTMTATLTTPSPVPAPGTFQRNRRRRRRRLVAWIVGLVLLVVAAAVGFRLYLDTQWFVGVDRGRVAVLRGIPSTFLGIKLYGLVERTELSAAAVEPLRASWRDLGTGLDPVGSRAKAEVIVDNMRTRLTEVQQQGVGKSTGG